MTKAESRLPHHITEQIMNWRGLRAQPFGHTIAPAAACPPVRSAHQPQTSRPASDA